MPSKKEKAMPRKTEQIPHTRIHIEGFSCIKELTVQFSQLTVLIGEQASGKSMLCKLYYFFTKVLRNEFEKSIRKDVDFNVFGENIEKQFREIFPEMAWEYDTFLIEWETPSWRIIIKHDATEKILTFSFGSLNEIYQKVLAQVHSWKEKQITDNECFEEDNKFVRGIFFSLRLDRLLERTVNVSTITYIPAGRSFFATIQDNAFTLLTENNGIDYFLQTFGRTLEGMRHRYRRGMITLEKDLCDAVLHGQYDDTGKDQWIVRDGKHKILLADASSGQQEALPLLLVLSYLSTSTRHGIALIEELEAHLYPTAQRTIIDYIGKTMAKKRGKRGFILTTHSPFILCCLNNLLLQKKLAVSDVAAYHLHDGTADDILNTEVGLIDAVRFDDVSIQIMNGE